MESQQSSQNLPGRILGHIRSGRLSTTFALLSALTIGVLAGSALTGRVSASGQKVDSSDARPLTIPNPVQLSNGFSSIVKQVGPAVVNINTESLPKKAGASPHGRRGQQNNNNDDNDGAPGNGNDMQDFLNRFFGGGGGNGGEDASPESGPRRALGSGFIVDPRGYIITNNHVVDKADHIYVKLASDPDSDIPGDPGRPATVVGVDPETDIAVIKIDTKTPLPTVKLGNSDAAQVGDWVLAIGSPFGLSQTVSAGIVSAKNRSIDEASETGVSQSQFQKFVQTDAAINPGNSGGPLVNMAGEVIGVNTAIYTQSMGSEGVGFAMPSNIVVGVYNMLIGPDHKVTRGSIGIQFQSVQSSAVTRMYGSATGGVLVSSIVPNGPAAKAGMQPQDVIISVDGQTVKNGDELVAIVSARRPGTTVKLGIQRDGKKLVLDVGIIDRAKLNSDLASTSDQATPPAESDAGDNKLGIKVQAITPQIATKLGVKGGVTVTTVRPGSFADEINLGRGEIITEINRHPVTDDASYRAVVNSLKSGDDVVFVVRDIRNPASGNGYVGGTLP
ncbi:serine protease Do [Bryocella elongata]|uniref:Serine protease Do n=2 Tax=Bryocella elongata TaxID=863522 RepID=A0A1H5THD3_9BACT|nr:serine protease Do [Bryocella elongata]